MQAIGSADETDGRDAEPVRAERLSGGFDKVRVVGEAEIIVGAEIQNLPPARDMDMRRLRRGQRAFGLPERSIADFGELFGERRQDGLGMVQHYSGLAHRNPASPVARHYTRICAARSGWKPTCARLLMAVDRIDFAHEQRVSSQSQQVCRGGIPPHAPA
jgi:hypothetical protein